MFEKFKQTWNQLKESPPGRRFQEYHQRCQARRKSRWGLQRVSNVAGGLALIVVGLVLVPGPGPGWVIVFVGGAILGGEFRPIACFLDRAELKARKGADRAVRAWGQIPAGGKALLGLLALTLIAGLGYGTYTLIAQQEGRLWKGLTPLKGQLAVGMTAPVPPVGPLSPSWPPARMTSHDVRSLSR